MRDTPVTHYVRQTIDKTPVYCLALPASSCGAAALRQAAAAAAAAAALACVLVFKASCK